MNPPEKVLPLYNPSFHFIFHLLFHLILHYSSFHFIFHYPNITPIYTTVLLGRGFLGSMFIWGARRLYTFRSKSTCCTCARTLSSQPLTDRGSLVMACMIWQSFGSLTSCSLTMQGAQKKNLTAKTSLTYSYVSLTPIMPRVKLKPEKWQDYPWTTPT